jgi:pimeloyl-ACP methyl ester carboxylesterase
MDFLTRGDVRIAYQVHNPAAPGVPLLLSHGYSATGRMWDANVAALGADRPVITWDQRGHGRSSAPHDAAQYGEDACVGDMAALLDAAGARTAVIGGMSLGGYLTLAFHAAHPERCAALLLVDTGPGYRSDKGRDAWNAHCEERAAKIEAEGFGGGSSAETAAAAHDDPIGLAYAARHVMAQRDDHIMRSLPGIAVPTLVVVGARDTGFLGAADYMESHIAGARKVVIDDAGHAANMDRPDAFNAAARAFLDTLG